MNARILLTSLALASAVMFSSSTTAQKQSDRYGLHAGSGVSATAHRGRPSYRSARYDRSRYGRVIRRGSSHRAHRVWMPGRYTTSHQRVWIPERHERVWIDPVYGWELDSCGLRIRVVTHAGYWNDVHHPGFFESRPVRVWSPGYWRYR